jgi:predicted NBD/HSP70 family sugar kinase
MYLCIDIGGTKTLLALMTASGKILKTLRFPTDRDESTFLAHLASNISSLAPPKNLAAISVAVPGPIKNGRVLYLGNLPWRDFDPAPTLKKLFSNVKIFIENDANLAGLSEAEHLSGLSVYLTFSTGIGGGLIKDRTIAQTSDSFEPGHEKYPWNDRPIEWEDFASAHAISDYYKKPVTKLHGPHKWLDISRRLEPGLTEIISTIHPDHIIIGGPLALVFKKYQKPLLRALKSALPAPLPHIIKASRPETAVIYGCYIYAKDKLAKTA